MRLCARHRRGRLRPESGATPHWGRRHGACPSAPIADELYEVLADCVTADPADGSGKLAIADSKRLYQPGGGLASLERGVLAALWLLERRASRWRELWPVLDPHSLAQIDSLPWHDDFDEPLPIATSSIALARLLHDGCEAGWRATGRAASDGALSRAFNAAVARCDNKAEVLSLATLRLAGRMLAELPDGAAIVLCDKHGGRNRYAALLQEVFPDELVRVRPRERRAERL